MQSANVVTPGGTYSLLNAIFLVITGLGMKLLARNDSTAGPWINDAYFAPTLMMGALASAATFVTRAIGNSQVPAALRLFNLELMIVCMVVLVAVFDRFLGWTPPLPNSPSVRSTFALLFLNTVSVALFFASFLMAIKLRVI
jgi:hypothetical protein